MARYLDEFETEVLPKDIIPTRQYSIITSNIEGVVGGIMHLYISKSSDFSENEKDFLEESLKKLTEIRENFTEMFNEKING